MPSSNQHFEDASLHFILSKIFIDLPRRIQTQRDAFNIGEFAAEGLVGWLGAVIGSALPDMIEPANHPHHRGGFHSYEAMIGSGVAWLQADTWDLHPVVREFLRGTSFGYAHHLALDSATPRGLPSIMFR